MCVLHHESYMCSVAIVCRVLVVLLPGDRAVHTGQEGRPEEVGVRNLLHLPARESGRRRRYLTCVM